MIVLTEQDLIRDAILERCALVDVLALDGWVILSHDGLLIMAAHKTDVSMWWKCHSHI